jgi:aspartate aminotransferase
MENMDDAGTFQAAERMQGIGVSRILAIGARAAAMKRAGRPVIILGAGEPDFDTWSCHLFVPPPVLV